jgi:hypothetical protein
MQAPNQEALCFRDELDQWEEKYHCKVITSTRDTFQEMFDNDDTLAYEPASTAAIILTGGDEEAEAAALEVRILAPRSCNTIFNVSLCPFGRPASDCLGLN